MEQKKSNKALIILVIIFGVIIIGLSTFIVYDKVIKEKDDKTTEENQENNSNQEPNNNSENEATEGKNDNNKDEQKELTFTINGTNYGTISEKDIKNVTIIILKHNTLDPEYDVEKELKDFNKLKEIIDVINTSSLEDATNLETGYEFPNSILNIVYTKNGEEKMIQILGDYGFISGEGKSWINTLYTVRDKLDTKIRDTYYEI